jgi:hypothetical protein
MRLHSDHPDRVQRRRGEEATGGNPRGRGRSMRRGRLPSSPGSARPGRPRGGDDDDDQDGDHRRPAHRARPQPRDRQQDRREHPLNGGVIDETPKIPKVSSFVCFAWTDKLLSPCRGCTFSPVRSVCLYTSSSGRVMDACFLFLRIKLVRFCTASAFFL